MAMSMAAHSILLLFPLAAHSLTIAITGTNSGIGQSAARQLLEQGHEIIHACRDEAAARDAAARAGGGAAYACDLADLGSVRAFAGALARERPELDVLCLNAGVSPSRKAEAPARTRDGFEATIGVNHLGHFCLAALLRPTLAANAGRLVVTASGVHDPASPGGLVQGDAATGARRSPRRGRGRGMKLRPSPLLSPPLQARRSATSRASGAARRRRSRGAPRP